ncbi:MAG: hypothetical protein CFE23_11855 [Flavobacterium sp. BFFFF1]|uniref:DUF3010 family protein n=1 Tax=Flavobacterium sp. BFFFF1 TaxID=2015557 RepID=UPI000BCDBB3F|nr:DUF3010 family protein [Flavobacterium sp. BFFFF1]OYU79942.1 MAG: hypothetical protein CFE23_11855 [Flavobacterium sp. BFFFF1]
MKVLGIEISGREVRIVALEGNNGDITDYTDKYKPVKLEDDEIAENVVLFKNALFAAFENFSPDEIVIKYRNPKGKGLHAPSPISFKIEGIIQLYNKAKISLVNPSTIAAFYKKNTLELNAQHGYQAEALKIAFHHIKTK